MTTGRPGGQQHRFDHDAGLAYFVSLHPTERTYNRVAVEFKVSHHTVRKWAKRNGWDEAARKADERAAAKALEASMRSREQRAVQTVRLRDLAADRLERKLTPDEDGAVALDDTTTVQVWKEADRQYRLDIGEATDRISIPEVREFLQQFVLGFDELLVAVLDESLGNGKRQVVLQAVRERVPALLEQTAGSVAGVVE